MKTLRIFSLLLPLTVALTVGLQNCNKAEPDPVSPGTTNPGSTTTVTTSTVPLINTVSAPATSGIASTSATVAATIEGNGGAAISQHGFVWSKTAPTPTVADSKTELGATSGPFPLAISSKLTGLDANTTYYVRAYATNNKGTGYGAVAQVKTEGTAVAGEITGTWVERARFPLSARRDYHLVSANGKIYLLCGNSQKSNNIFDVFYDAWEYDPATDKWTEKAKTSITRTAIFFPQIKPLVANGKIFFPSGVGPTPYDVKANIHEFDPVANKWSVKGALPTDFDPAGTTAFVVGNKAYFLGHSSSKGFVKNVWEYDIPTDKWVQKAPFSGALGVSGIGASIDGKGLAIGVSGNDNVRPTSWQYDPTTDKWITIGQPGVDYLVFGRSNLGLSMDKIVEYRYSAPKTDGITPLVLMLNPFRRVTLIQPTKIPHPVPCNGSLAAGMTFVHVGERTFVMIDQGYQTISAWTDCEKAAMGKLFELVKK